MDDDSWAIYVCARGNTEMGRKEKDGGERHKWTVGSEETEAAEVVTVEEEEGGRGGG